MKLKNIRSVSPSFWMCACLAVLLLLVVFFLNLTVFYVTAIIALPVLAFCIFRLVYFQRDIRCYMQGVAATLNWQDRQALNEAPMPVALISDNNELVWYNEHFRREVLGGNDSYGIALSGVFEGLSAGKLAGRFLPNITATNNKTFSLFVGKIRLQHQVSYVLYCTDITELSNIASEYHASRPVVLSLLIDNGEEVLQNLRESDRARLISQVETVLEDLFSQHSGVFRKCGTYRYLALLEQRALEKIQEERFTVLDKVRALPTDTENLTLSIGVGTGKSFADAEMQSHQALDMALGRGGDQAAVKTTNGFDFYGGVSKSVERRTKVRSRVVASALQELIAESDNILLMGHRYSDLDCLGAAAALTAVCRSMGKPAYTVYDSATTLAKALVNRYTAHGHKDFFIEADDALPLLTPKTLLIITDIHQPNRLDFPELYRKAQNVAVIDHHRKMVEHIDDAVLFYHEPNASSTAEMTAELIQYMSDVKITRLEAEALLAGIMLDTRNFVMKAGVRTFEAAAYLRKAGADTVEVKRMFAEDMSTYQKKAEIVSVAETYRAAAIACTNEGGNELRIAASQAADELLCVRDVDASFVLFYENDGVNISARSFGNMNVQLIMEALGGGGHQTMAGAYLPNMNLKDAKAMLLQALDTYSEERSRRLKSL